MGRWACLKKRCFQSPISVPFPVSSWCSQKEPDKQIAWGHEPPDSGNSVQGPRLCLFLLTEMEVRLPWEEYGSCVDSNLSVLKYFSNIKMMWLCLSRHSFIWPLHVQLPVGRWECSSWCCRANAHAKASAFFFCGVFVVVLLLKLNFLFTIP